MRPRALACVPSSAGPEQREIVMQVARNAGIRRIAITAEPLAAAIGSNVDIGSPWAQMIVDIGDGVTDLAIIRGGQTLHTSTLDLACSDLRDRVAHHVESRFDVTVDDQESERLLRLACAIFNETDQRMWLAEAFDGASGKMAALCVSSADVLECIEPVVTEISQFLRDEVRNLPASMATEVIENGMWITGGGATLPRLTHRIERTTRLDVHRPIDPLHAVITGAGLMLSVAESTLLWQN